MLSEFIADGQKLKVMDCFVFLGLRINTAIALEK